MKEIPNTKLIVSLHHICDEAANLEIFDISKKGQAKKIYSLGEISGCKICLYLKYKADILLALRLNNFIIFLRSNLTFI